MNQSRKEFWLRLTAAVALLAVLFGLAHNITEGEKPSFKFQNTGGAAVFTPSNAAENPPPTLAGPIDPPKTCALVPIRSGIGDGREVARAIAKATNALDADTMEAMLTRLTDTLDYRLVSGWLGNPFADSLETYNRFGEKANRTLVNTLLGDGMGWTLLEKTRFEKELLRMGLVRRGDKWALSLTPQKPDGTTNSTDTIHGRLHVWNRPKAVGNHPVRAGT